MFAKSLSTPIFARQSCCVFLIAIIVIFCSISYYADRQRLITPTLMNIVCANSTSPVIPIMNVPKHLNIVDLKEQISENITCIKTKLLLHSIRTTLCVHYPGDYVSYAVMHNKMWEEGLLAPLLGMLIRYPHMGFIDVGANIGSYTMFTAAMGRFTLAIECFRPNIQRIRKAVSIEKLENNVVLVGNAIFTKPGIYLRLFSEPSNIGSQAILVDKQVNESIHDNFVVKTMRFDDILPILRARNIREAVMKVDIQLSEAFLCETGAETFASINIPVVLMEWAPAPQYLDRMTTVLNFFTQRGYVPTVNICNLLNITAAFKSWPGDVYWVKMNRSELC